jgi:hypothetical protein
VDFPRRKYCRASDSAKLAASIASLDGSNCEGTAMSTDNLDTFLRLSKDALDLLKSALPFLPRGKQRDDAETKLKAAEKSLAESKAELAQKLGYKLCQCTFPPQIMLWQESQKAEVCPNPNCGRTIARPGPAAIGPRRSITEKRRGR